jgi:hypothetical protein
MMYILSLLGPNLARVWHHPPRSYIAVIIILIAAGAIQAQDRTDPWKNERLPPSRDLFIPYAAKPALTEQARLQQVETLEQLRILAEINSLTVELVKRRSDPALARADTPVLVKRLQELAHKLREHL